MLCGSKGMMRVPESRSWESRVGRDSWGIPTWVPQRGHKSGKGQAKLTRNHVFLAYRSGGKTLKAADLGRIVKRTIFSGLKTF